MINLNDKIKGSLLGLVYGDALGVPIESWKAEYIKKVYGNYDDFPIDYPLEKMSFLDKKFKRLRPLGIYSDDTQQALLLINICLSQSGWNVKDFAEALVKGMNMNSWRGIGSRFEESVINLKNGYSIYQSGSESAGVGAAMRIAPIAALFHNNYELLRKIVIESSLVTHREITAVSLTYTISKIIYDLINNKDIQNIIRDIPKEVKEFELDIINNFKEWNVNITYRHAFSEVLDHILSLNINDIPYVRQKICDISSQYLDEEFKNNIHPNDPFTLLGGIHSIIMGLQRSLNPKDALISIMNLGADTDTVGAISGGILGARYGYEWINIDKIIEKNKILDYANSLISNNKFENLEEFLERESYLTACENEFIQSL